MIWVHFRFELRKILTNTDECFLRHPVLLHKYSYVQLQQFICRVTLIIIFTLTHETNSSPALEMVIIWLRNWFPVVSAFFVFFSSPSCSLSGALTHVWSVLTTDSSHLPASQTAWHATWVPLPAFKQLNNISLCTVLQGTTAHDAKLDYDSSLDSDADESYCFCWL